MLEGQNKTICNEFMTGHLEKKEHSYMKEEFVPGPSHNKIWSIFRKWQKGTITSVWYKKMGYG